MTQTQIERMAEAMKEHDDFIKSGEMGCPVTWEELRAIHAQAALSSMPEPIANYRPEMGAVARRLKSGNYVFTERTEHEGEYIWIAVNYDAWDEDCFTPYFVQIPKEWEVMG